MTETRIALVTGGNRELEVCRQLMSVKGPVTT